MLKILNCLIVHLSILEYIDKGYQSQSICKHIRAFIVREFFTQEKDCIDSEVLVTIKDNKTELGFLSDYEYEWINISSNYSLSGLLKLDISNPQIIFQIQNDSFFQDTFAKALEINVEYLLGQIKEEHKIRLIDYDKNNYKEKLIKNLIRSKKLVKEKSFS